MAGDQYAGKAIRFKPVRLVITPQFNQKLAQAYFALDLSGDATVDWIFDRIYLRNSWPIMDRKDLKLDIEMVDLEAEFGEDPGRYINAYKEKRLRVPAQHLHHSLVMRITWMDVAMEIHRRWTGRSA